VEVLNERLMGLKKIGGIAKIDGIEKNQSIFFLPLPALICNLYYYVLVIPITHQNE
jgi:hypothetical protein